MAVLPQRVENRYIRRDLVGRTGLRKLHLELDVVGVGRRSADKILEMHGGVRPMPGHVAHRVHQAARPAAIKMSAALLFEYRPEVIGLIGVAIVVVQHDLAVERA